MAVAVAAAGGAGKASAGPQVALKAAMVSDTGNINDRSFNHLSKLGLDRAKKELHAQTRIFISRSKADYLPNFVAAARANYNAIVATGFLLGDDMSTAATQFPKSKFAIVDVDVTSLKHKPKNVQGLLFKEQEAGYLVGYMAGLYAKSKNITAVSSVGGIKLPPVDRYIAGFQYGAKKADPGITTLNGYSQDFVDQAKCKEVALDQIAQGSGVVFQVAGQCGLGALDAAKEKNAFGIGVDADQFYLGAHIMTSALKRVDVAVFSAITAAQNNGLKTGINAIYDAKKNGVAFGKVSPRIPASIKTKVNAQLKLLKAGKIKGIPQSVK